MTNIETQVDSYLVCICVVPNKNNRIYPKKIMRQALAKVRFPIFGVLINSIQDGEGSTIDLQKVSHVIEGATLSDTSGEIIAKIKPTNTPEGLILKRLLDVDAIAFRPRSLVTYEPNQQGPMIVKTCSIVSFDAISKDNAS